MSGMGIVQFPWPVRINLHKFSKMHILGVWMIVSAGQVQLRRCSLIHVNISLSWLKQYNPDGEEVLILLERV